MRQHLPNLVCLSLALTLFGGSATTAQTALPDDVRAARRSARLLARANLVPEARLGTSVVGSVWSPDDAGVPGVGVRLRNLVAGALAAVTETDHAGNFAFGQVPEGTYLLEVAEHADEDSAPIAFGDIFTIGRNETVAVFVQLPAPVGWPSTLAAMLDPTGGAAARAGGATEGGSANRRLGTFETVAAALVAAAAGAGVTGLGGGNAASIEDPPQ